MYSDEDLTAFLDGELDAQKTAAVTHDLANDPALANRLAALDIDKAGLALAFEPLLAQAPKFVETTPVKWPRFAGYGIAACALLAIGAGMAGLISTAKTGWEVEVAHYQALYVEETLSSISPDTARLQGQLTHAGDLLGLELKANDLDGFEGLTLRRAQVLGFEGHVLIQIAYTMTDGTPVAFCILKRQNSVDTQIEGVELVELAAATWQNADHGFLTIGGNDIDQMTSFAAYLQAALNKPNI